MYQRQKAPAEYDPIELDRELEQIEQALQLGMVQLKELFVEPEKPRIGMVVLADGSSWNPGAGAGVYCYYNATWNRLG